MWISLLIVSFSICSQNEEVDKKYAGLLEKKWTSVIRLQKKVRNICMPTDNVSVLCVDFRKITVECYLTPLSGSGDGAGVQVE